jgi:hypothetical protein
MRTIISIASGLFVVLGALIFLVSTPKVLAAMGSASQGQDAGALMIGGAMWIASALIILIGGASYMLTEIDIKLERMAATTSGTSDSSPNFNPVPDYLG